MAKQRYMLRIPDNKVFIYHPETIKKSTMVEISEQQAMNLMQGKPLMEGLSFADVQQVLPGQIPTVHQGALAGETQYVTELAYYKHKLGIALGLLGIENPDLLPEDLAEGKVIMDDFVPAGLPGGEAPAETANAGVEAPTVDPDIAMLEKIRNEGKGKSKVEAYILRNYGIAVDPKAKLRDLVDMAVDLRNKTLAQGAQAPTPAEEQETAI
jgi:hypothetical protein